MAGHPSDVELMLKVKHGDREAFSVLLQRYRKPLINFIYRFTSNSGDSEDLAHEVFLKGFLPGCIGLPPMPRSIIFAIVSRNCLAPSKAV